MKSLKQLCVPRDSVFDKSRRDIVLDVTDLLEEKINPSEFFEENFPTDGMKQLLQHAFRRFAGKSDQGVFVLSQAMGGGKTHNMISLGLLAKHHEIRTRVMGNLYHEKSLGKVRVVGFTGRETDAPFGIWGALAQQLSKKELFKDYYSPLSAPGQTAWVNLLKGDPLLILLDELPPYLQYAKAVSVGHSDLSEVTTAALANLLVAIGKGELSNVCVVISDLKATYQQGGQQITRALQNLENEVGRSALTLEPVGLNTNEIYHILRKRLFEQLPKETEINEVVQAYAKAVRDAKQMEITNVSPEKFAKDLKDSYPFHFAIRDLYARFRENPGFQQTRGLIRLMRVVVSRLYDSQVGCADKIQVIHAQDLDLNDRDTLAEINQINPSLGNAISHDIASDGLAIAEVMDSNLKGTDAQDVCRLLLVSSLANVPNAVLGLSIPEIVSYLCAPGRDVTKLPKEILGNLSTSAWYLHSNTQGKLFFRNVQNLVAKLKSTATNYTRETSLRELRSFLENIFKPALKDCYQEILALPPVDEITTTQEKVTIVICEPYPGGGLSPDLLKFYENETFKNRVLFLSGQRGPLDTRLETAAELKAIGAILDEMDLEKVPPNDPQRVAAGEMRDKIQLRLLSAARETFNSLTYPHGDGLMTADFLMNYKDNKYNGENQVRETLREKQKFTEDIASDVFRRKCEQRLFTQRVMLWSEVKKRAAIDIRWQWHHPDALDNLKNDLVHKDQWRENGGYVEKPPFPRPQTQVQVQEMSRTDDTGEVTLKLKPVNGDTIHYEIGAPATTGSMRLDEYKSFKTKELDISFLCVDSTHEHETGEPYLWKGRITLKSRLYSNGPKKMVELRSAPEAPVRYTTNGSDPKGYGGLYDGPFEVPHGTVCVLAVAQKGAVTSDLHRLDIDWTKKEEFEIDPDKPIIWKRMHAPTSTKESYEFLGRARKHAAKAAGPRVNIVGENWIELNFDDRLTLDADKLEAAINHMRGVLTDGQVSLEVPALHFPRGQNLLDWAAEVRITIRPEEVQQ